MGLFWGHTVDLEEKRSLISIRKVSFSFAKQPHLLQMEIYISNSDNCGHD